MMFRGIGRFIYVTFWSIIAISAIVYIFDLLTSH